MTTTPRYPESLLLDTSGDMPRVHAASEAGDPVLIDFTGRLCESERESLGELVRRYNLHGELVDALKKAALRTPEDGPCFCVVPIPADTAHHLSCQHIRAVLAEAQGGV